VSDPGFDIVRDLDVAGRLGDPETNGRVEDDALHGLRVVSIGDFAAVDEASAEALLGDEENTVLAAGGTFAFYGDGGAGKTTLEADLVMHLAAGIPWLGLPVPRPVRVLVIENEGPRGKFRRKLRAKLAAWEGPSVDEWVVVLEEPWSMFSFAEEAHREALRGYLVEHDIDVVAAGPVQALGMQGGGTPDEVGAFMLAIEQTRARLERPLAFVLIHHENKQGDVSGAWQGRTDTLAHVQAQGNGATRVYWRKVRWGSTLHEQTWKLLWRDGEGFELDETPERTPEDVADEIVTHVRDNPGTSWNSVEHAISGKAKTKREQRDRLLEDGVVVNVGSPKSFRLYVADDPTIPQLRPGRDAPGTHPASGTGSTDLEGDRVPRPPLQGTQGRGRTPGEPDDDGLEWR
jgi:hypothetical protein